MRTLTVRLPEPLAAQIDAESRERKVSKSDVVRERLQAGVRAGRRRSAFDSIADLSNVRSVRFQPDHQPAVAQLPRYRDNRSHVRSG